MVAYGDDAERAIAEMARVLKREGTLLVANLTGFASAPAPGWVRDDTGKAIHCHPVDNYLDERSEWFEWEGIRIRNWYRPLSTYMRLLLKQGLFDLPSSTNQLLSTMIMCARAKFRRPWAIVMEWCKD